MHPAFNEMLLRATNEGWMSACEPCSSGKRMRTAFVRQEAPRVDTLPVESRR